MSAITVSVIGGGTMGTGIAYVFSQSGAEVTVVEPDTARAAAMQASLARAVASGISRGKLDQAREREPAGGRIRPPLLPGRGGARRTARRVVAGAC